MIKRLLIIFTFIFPLSFCTAWAQDDIEVTDSTSTDWDNGENGEISPQTPTGPVTSMTLSQASVSLAGGEVVRLVATINQDAANKSVTWTSANSEIATVDTKGRVRGMKIGSTTITATSVENTNIKQSCTVTVTSDYDGPIMPNVPFEFFFNAIDYEESTHSIPNHFQAQIQDASLQLTDNIPSFINGEFLRINNRCKGFIDKWGFESTESGSHFYRHGEDCMTIVAKVAPKLNTGNASDFVSNRGNGYNYMWRIASDYNTTYIHTNDAYSQDRSIQLTSEIPQILAVRVDGVNNFILLENLTTGIRKKIGNVNWGGGDNVFKLFYNNDEEFFTGDFYWMYYSFELLSDSQIATLAGILKGDVDGDGARTAQDASLVLQLVAGKISEETPGIIYNAANVDGDNSVTAQDASLILQHVAGKINIGN